MKCYVFAVAFGIVASMSNAIAQETAATSAPQALAVGTVEAKLAAISKSLSFVGRIQAIERVEIIPRVSGYLEEILFKEGDFVQVGAPLYRIEQGLFEAAVQQAEGAVASAKAAVVLAQQQKQRYAELQAKEVASKMTLDQVVAQVQNAAGDQQASEANLKTAQINLGYTDIKSPIAGKIGRTAVTKGNVVGPSTGVLTVIVSQDPMYVLFPVSQREFLKAQQAGQVASADKITVQLKFSDGSIYDQTGKIDFVSATTNQATDTIDVRAVFANPKSALVDGQLVTVQLDASKPVEMIVIPQSALLADQVGAYVFVVEDNKAAVKRVRLGGENGADMVITEGLSGGEQVIVEGLQFVRPGAPVTAAPATLANPS